MHLSVLLQNVVHVATILLLPPLLLGVIGKTKAAFAGRVGAPYLQAYYDLLKLLKKGSVFSATTTWVFRAGPVVALSTALLAGLRDVEILQHPGLRVHHALIPLEDQHQTLFQQV